MLRLSKFEYLAPGSLEEACSLLNEHQGKTRLLAGGTDLLPSMKQGLFAPGYVLDLKKIDGLDDIKGGSDKEVKIGALCTLTSIEESRAVTENFPSLAYAASVVGAPCIRNMGTIGGNVALETRCLYFNQSRFWRNTIEKCIKLGGNVCHVVKGAKRCYACFMADTVPVLMALDARVVIKGINGTRRCHIKELYTHEGRSPNNLRSTDIIAEIILTMPDKRSGSSYKKLRLRQAIDYPLAGAAAHVVMEGDTCMDARIVLAAAGSGPVEVTEAQDFLIERPITKEVIKDVGEMAQKAAHPVANMTNSPEYRRKMAGVFAQRALKEAVMRARER
ncbi:MAG: FAD binding domain-containing protein [Thermodesulfobacteriota bacterium]|nr:FAD binding domain-containing protein [Thermodesulfobacteriota bacterium]